MPDQVELSPIIKLNGTPMSDQMQAGLHNVRVERELQVPGRLTLRFLDPGYVLAQESAVALGTEIEVKDPSAGTVLLSGEITSVAVEQLEGEQPELVIVGHDKSHRLGRATAVNTYQEMTYSDVVNQLARSAGLTPSVDSTTLILPYLMQVDSDLGLLTEMARRVGYDWWVEGSSLHFKKPAAGSTVSLALGEEHLLSFSVKASGHHPDSVTVDGWDRDQQELVTSTARSATPGVASKSDLADQAGKRSGAFGSANLLTFGLGAQSASEAETLGQAIFDRGAASGVTARGVCIGNPEITLGATVEVTKAGPLSGTYPVTAVEHLYRAGHGFRTRFRCGDRRSTSLVETLAGGPTMAMAGSAHHHAGLSVAMVTNINDPEHRGRVKVRFPGLSSNQESGWARLVAIGGGAKRGNVFIPEVNDEVLVAFEGGDPRQPVVLGGLFGAKSTIPATSLTDGKVQERAMTSRLGHIVSLLDGEETAQQAIEMKLAGGEHSVHLGKDKLSFNVPAGLPVEIVAGNSSLKFDKEGNLTITAPKVAINAEAKLTMKGADVQVSGDASLKAQAAVVQVQGSGALQLKGGATTIAGTPVAIN